MTGAKCFLTLQIEVASAYMFFGVVLQNHLYSVIPGAY